ncbi:hypothetical protein [Salinigranum sp. GCM10025319]|uniref:hypothetical protein n=1 Tax=Salinigranum sp. GCM10025319 TaxID=3252687 RepID=UPI00360803F0
MSPSHYPLLAIGAVALGGAAALLDYLLGYTYGPIAIALVGLIGLVLLIVALKGKLSFVTENL